MRFAKPIDTELLKDIFSKFDKVITVEEGILDGGFGESVLDYLHTAPEGKLPRVKTLGLPCDFITHGERNFY
jgi:1-deoxy-D-xylulose-5-phosphate synthase (EC 2.2.1.7)